MKIDGKVLTPAPSNRAGPNNYCWWNGDVKFEPRGNPGHIFETKEDFAVQLIRDYPDGETIKITGSPTQMGIGSVVGGKGFGWVQLNPLQQFWTRFPHIGGVWFGSNVELGSNVTIDRGALGDTEIGSGVKIDNGVHIGHNAWIGKNTLITAHAVIGGSAIIGEDCWIGLGAIIKQHVTVGAGATIGMGAIILEDVPAGETWVGNPGRKLR